MCHRSEPAVANVLDSFSIDWPQHRHWSSKPQINEDTTATVDREGDQVTELLEGAQLSQDHVQDTWGGAAVGT